MKIAIAGIGGVGGYLGGRLAAHYQQAQDIEIYFIARGEHQKAIQDRGLQVQTPEGSFTAHPRQVTSDPVLVGPVDLVLCCTKTYDLEESLHQLRPMIHKGTAILTLQNGVDSYGRIKAHFPFNEVWEGCVYMVSRLLAPGCVRETGTAHALFFGCRTGANAKIKEVEALFNEAQVNACLSADIVSTIWQKFVFISSFATLTSYKNKTIGAILEDPQSSEQLYWLLQEVMTLAHAKNIYLAGDTIEKTFEKRKALAYEATSSMHSDFLKGGATELESLTGYVVREAQGLQLSVPNYRLMYECLKRQSENQIRLPGRQ